MKLILFLLISMGMVFPAYAQQLEIDKTSMVLEEVIVTATKQGETDLQNTPMSITAFNSNMLHAGSLHSIVEIADFTPGLEVSANANIAQVTIRGIGSNTTLSGGEASSTIQLDGVYMARPSTALIDFIDVERVEVLRGPQGTLYGRNATAGTINIITRKPTDELQAEAVVSYGSYDALRFDGVLRGPLIKDMLQASFSIQKTDRDGFIKNMHPNSREDIGELDRLQLRGQLRFVPGENLEIRLAMDYADINETMLYYAKPLLPLGLGEAVFDDIHTVSIDFDPVYKHEIKGISATLNYEINHALSLTSITAWRESDMSISGDLDATDIPFLRTEPLPEHQDQFSQEVQLNYKTDRLDLIGGVYFFNEEIESFFFLKIFPLSIAQHQGRDAGTDAWALYAEASYDLTDKLSLTAGLRYSKDDKDGRAYGGFYGLNEGPAPTPQFVNNETADFSAVTPKFAIDYRVNNDVLLYVSVSRGYKAGGFNFISAPGEDGVFDKESVWAYEAGFKATFADGKVKLSAAAFHNDYQNLQVTEFLGAGTERVRNATNATINGGELELSARPIAPLTLRGSIAYLDATYDGSFLTLDPITGIPIDADGNRLNNAPELSGSFIARYDWELPVGNISLRGETSFKDAVFYSPSNNAFEAQDGLALINARLAYTTQDKRFELSLNGRNLTDEEYITGAALFLGPTGRPALDRTVTVTMKYIY